MTWIPAGATRRPHEHDNGVRRRSTLPHERLAAY